LLASNPYDMISVSSDLRRIVYLGKRSPYR
jgi:hypothetical protein